MAKENFYSQDTIPNLTDLSSFPTPSMVGPYRIESQLTKGGMSFLYLATHPKSLEPVVVKILSPKFITNKEMVSRFLKEAEIISMTDHPNIVKLYDQGKWEKGLYIAMEFVQGISLRQFILQKSLSQKRALQIIQEVAYALLHLHTHGVIHRDLKPENILITESGNIKVIDFGIAQLFTEIPKKLKNKKGKVIGTPVYMSPEQKENPDMASFFSDIYSLGIIAYELVLGRFSHGLIHLSFLPKNLRPIIEKALQVDPSLRYPDVVDIIIDINAYLKALDNKKENEPFGDALENFLKHKEDFFGVKLPSWPQIELGFDKQKEISLTGLYLDFFKLAESNYLIVLAEPTTEGTDTFIKCASFKGMMQSLMYPYNVTDKEFHLTTFLNEVNKISSYMLKSYYFDCVFLLLNSALDKMTFISCGDATIFHYSLKSEKVRELKTVNDPIGKNLTTSFLETTDTWHAGDYIFVPSKQLKNVKNFQSAVTENLLLSPQKQTEKILYEVYDKKVSKYQRDLAVLSILRVF